MSVCLSDFDLVLCSYKYFSHLGLSCLKMTVRINKKNIFVIFGRVLLDKDMVIFWYENTLM